MRALWGLLALVVAAVALAAIASRLHPGGDLPPSEQDQSNSQNTPPAKPTSTTPAATASTDAAEFDKYKAGAIHASLVIKDRGTIGMEFYPKAAPKSVEHIVGLIKKGFYTGIKFHRVENWVIQAGDPKTKDMGTSEFEALGAGTHGSGTGTVPLEASLPHVTGAVGLARSQDPNSGDSQFYIVLQPAPQINGQYCIFGRIVSGGEIPAQVKLGDVIEKFTVQ